MTSGTAWRFGLLGPLTVRRGEEPVPIAGAHQRVLLAALLLQPNSAVSVDELVDVLWAGVPAATARARLQNHVMRLRHSLGDWGARLETRQSGYLARVEPQELDVATFESLLRVGRTAMDREDWAHAKSALDDAVGAWRGAPLSDVDSDALKSRHVPRLTEICLQAHEWRADAALRLGEHREVVAQLRGLVVDHPFRERLHGQLMTALYRSGLRPDALAVFRALRATLVEELGIEPSPELRSLHEAILRDELPPAPAAASGPATPAATADRSALMQLPNAIADFTGRRDPVARALRLLTPATDQARHPQAAVPIVAVSGLGGIGKTALAIHVAHLLRHCYPDGQIYVNLRGAHAAPTPASEVLAAWLHDLGLPESVLPAGTDQRAAAFRSAVDGRRMLFLLDDAKDAAHIQHLIPGASGCAVLVTSRSRMSGLDGAWHLDLPVLGAAEAWELLSTVAGRASVEAAAPAAREILASCAGLPLAIRIIGTRVSGRFLATIPALAERLRKGSTGLGELRHHDRDIAVVFEQAFAALRADDSIDGGAAHRLLLLCAHWTGPDLGLAEAARLGGLTGSQAERLIDYLIEVNLLQMLGEGRFGFHDLVRAYAVECAAVELDPQEIADAAARLVQWYLHSADAAARVITPHRMHALGQQELQPPGEGRLDFADYEEALTWLTAQRPNLVAAARTAAARGLYRAAWQLPGALWDLFNLRGHWQEWVELNELGIDAARALGDSPAEAWSCSNLGASLHRLGRLDEAVRAQLRARTIHERNGHLKGAAAAAFNLGALYSDLGRQEEALGAAARALELYREAGSRVGEGHATAMAGLIHLAQGAYPSALAQLEGAAAIYRETADRRNEASVLTSIGSALLSLGRAEQAIEVLTRAIDANVEVGHLYDEALGHEKLGEAYLEVGDPARAEPQFRAAHRIFAQTSPSDATRVAEAVDRVGRPAPS